MTQNAAHDLQIDISPMWCDLFRPKSFAECLMHSELNARLSVHTRDIDSRQQMPHILLTGPPGCGKRTRALCLIAALFKISRQELFDLSHRDDVRDRQMRDRIDYVVRDGIEYPLDDEQKQPHLRNVSINIALTQSRQEKCDKAKDGIQVLYSPVHLEMTPSDVNFCDTKIIQQTLKSVFATDQRLVRAPSVLDSLADGKQQQHVNPNYRVVVFNHFDRMSIDAQTAMRRIMEDYSKVARFILIATCVDHVISPIISRCSVFAMPRPRDDELYLVLKAVLLRALPAETCTQAVIDASDAYLKKIVLQCAGNATRAVVVLEASIHPLIAEPDRLINFFQQGRVAQPDWIFSAMDCVTQICQVPLEAESNRHTYLCETMCELLKRRVPISQIVHFVDENVRRTLTKQCHLITDSVRDMLHEHNAGNTDLVNEAEVAYLVSTVEDAEQQLANVCADVSSACTFYHTRAQKSQFPVIHLNALMLCLVTIVNFYQNALQLVDNCATFAKVCRPFSWRAGIGKLLLGTNTSIAEKQDASVEAASNNNDDDNTSLQQSSSSVAKEMTDMCLNATYRIDWDAVAHQAAKQKISTTLVAE